MAVVCPRSVAVRRCSSVSSRRASGWGSIWHSTTASMPCSATTTVRCAGSRSGPATAAVLARARKGVVFGSGGLPPQRRLVRDFLPGKVFGGCAAITNTGDFLRSPPSSAPSWPTCAVPGGSRSSSSKCFAAPDALGRVGAWGDSMIQVNRYGRRVVNEKAPYNERAQVHATLEPDRAGVLQPGRAVPIWDEAVTQVPTIRRARIPIPTRRARPLRGARARPGGARRAASTSGWSHWPAHTGGVRLTPRFPRPAPPPWRGSTSFARDRRRRRLPPGREPDRGEVDGTGRPGSGATTRPWRRSPTRPLLLRCIAGRRPRHQRWALGSTPGPGARPSSGRADPRPLRGWQLHRLDRRPGYWGPGGHHRPGPRRSATSPAATPAASLTAMPSEAPPSVDQFSRRRWGTAGDRRPRRRRDRGDPSDGCRRRCRRCERRSAARSRPNGRK